MSAQDRNVTRHVSQLLGAGDGVKGRSRRLPVLWLPTRCSPAWPSAEASLDCERS